MGIDFLSWDRRMVILITIVHVVVCLFLAIVVLLQSGKAADLAGAFGGMGSQTVFGPRGSATVLSKATTIAAALFMLTSLTLSIISTRAGKASPAIFQKVVPVTQPKGGAPGGTIPMTVTPSNVGGKEGAPQTIHVPVNQTPPENKKK
jgi:preprotein translocase subunit SecG